MCLCIGFVTHAFLGMYLKFRGRDQGMYLMCSSFSTHVQVSKLAIGTFVSVAPKQPRVLPGASTTHHLPCLLVPQDKTVAGRREKGLTLFFVTFLCS